MIELFADLRRLLRETCRTITVVIDAPSGPYAVAVDEVTGVEWLTPAPTEGELAADDEANSSMVTSMAHGGDGTHIVDLLDVESVAGGFVTGAATAEM